MDSEPYSHINDNFCIAPWVTLYAQANNTVSPCCVFNDYTDSLESSSIKDAWNIDGVKNIRKRILNGDTPEPCKRACQMIEKANHTSHRQKLNSLLPNEQKIIDATVDGEAPFNMKYFDLRLTNLCNFKCRFCGFGLSSRWKEDLVARYPGEFTFPMGHNNTIQQMEFKDSVMRNKLDLNEIKDVVLPIVEYLQFLGGEPLIDVETYEILEHLIKIKRTKVPISITTNMSSLSYKDKNLLDYLPQFRKIRIGASLDGFGDRAAYMRKGTKWKTIEKNIFSLKEAQRKLGKYQLELQIVHTVYALNIFHSMDAYQYFRDTFGVDEEDMRLNLCFSPDGFQIDALPLDAKKLALDKYLKFNEPFYQPVVNILENSITNHSQREEDLFKHLKGELSAMDKIRNETFLNTFPEYKDFWY